MKKSTGLKQKLSSLKDEVQNLLDKNNTSEAEEKMKEVRQVKNELDKALEDEEIEMNKLKNLIPDNQPPKEDGLKVKDKAGRVINIVNKGELFTNVTRAENTENLELGKYLRGMVTGNWENASKEMNQFKALNTSTGTTLIPRPLASQIIDIARNNMVLADIPIIPMETNNLTIAKIVEDPKFGYKKELGQASLSDMTFAPIELKTKMIYGLMKISLELFHSAANIESVLKDAMAKAMAQAIDKSGLYGKGYSEEQSLYEPLGITNVDGINIITDVAPIETSKYTSFINGIGAITKANGTPTHMSYNSDIDTKLNLLVDTTGQPLNAPSILSSLNKKVSNNIEDNQSLIYDNNAIVMGLQKDISIDTSKELGFTDGSVYFRIYAMVDFAVLKPKNVTQIKYKTV